MICKLLDTYLLLLAHGELASWQAELTRRHLGGCACCRERYELLNRSSVAFSEAVGGSGATPWRPQYPLPSPSSTQPLSSGSLLGSLDGSSRILVVGLLALLTALTLMVSLRIRSAVAASDNARASRSVFVGPRKGGSACRMGMARAAAVAGQAKAMQVKTISAPSAITLKSSAAPVPCNPRRTP